MHVRFLGVLVCVLALGSAAAQTPPPAPAAAPAARTAPGPGFSLADLARQTQARLDAANATEELRGSGPYPALMEQDFANPNVTIYRPADLSALGNRKLGLIVWGNGGCSNDSAGARAHLAELASHGYLVVAPGKALTGPTPMGAPEGAPMMINVQDMRDALDWALAENGRRGSVWYRRIDENAIVLSGHSCGGIMAIVASDDPRVDAVVLQSAAINPTIPDRAPLVQHYERLQALHTPVLMVMGGESDVLWQLGQETFNRMPVPVFLASIDRGHGLTMGDAHGGESSRLALAWLDWQLHGDREAARLFTGERCGLCTEPQWSVQRRGIR